MRDPRQEKIINVNMVITLVVEFDLTSSNEATALPAFTGRIFTLSFNFL